MNKEILKYNKSQSTEDRIICNLLAKEISSSLPEAMTLADYLHYSCWDKKFNYKLSAGLKTYFLFDLKNPQVSIPSSNLV